MCQSEKCRKNFHNPLIIKREIEVHAARGLSRRCKKAIYINRYLENKIAILREPILPAWQHSCKKRRKQAALARWAKVHPAREPSVYPAWRRLPINPAFIPLGGYPQTQRLSRLVAFCLLKSPLARAFLVGVKRFTAWRCRSRSGI